MRKVLLCILDGFGFSEEKKNNAIAQARTPNLNAIMNNNPHSLVRTDGEAVGLPEGQMGNSEVGHATIGAGRVLEQTMVIISNSFSKGLIVQNKEIKKLLSSGRQNRLHLVGMYSFGGVHSSAKHLHSLIQLVGKTGKEVILHLFSDGRDVPPNSFAQDILKLPEICKNLNVKLATICGRYYSMDRDGRINRTEAAFNAIAFGKAKQNLYIPENNEEDSSETVGAQLGGRGGKDATTIIANTFNAFYRKGITDEFMEPTVINDYHGIQESDDILFFNFRADRMVQLTEKFIHLTSEVFSQEQNSSEHKEFKGEIFTATNYFGNKKESGQVNVIFQKEPVPNVLGEVIDKAGIKQFRIAETEKYAHVTYFLNAGREEPFQGEKRVMVPSPTIATYDLEPEMSAGIVCSELINAIKSNEYGFAVVNFANCDMVGHTGNLKATIQAVEFLDGLLGELTKVALENNWETIITADHGNAEAMVDPNGIIHTQHTLNPVPFICIGTFCSNKKLLDGTLADIAPTVLDIMNIPKPREMKGLSMLKK